MVLARWVGRLVQLGAFKGGTPSGGPSGNGPQKEKVQGEDAIDKPEELRADQCEESEKRQKGA